MEDRYIGEMFLNLMLRKEVMNYCGVDISNDGEEEELGKGQNGRMVDMAEECDGYDQFALPYMTGGDMV